MRLGKGGSTLDIHAKPVEMDGLAVDHPHHHPAKRLQMARILPLNGRLNHKLVKRIIKTGS